MKTRLACATVVALVCAAPAIAADVRFNPFLNVTGLYDDNYRLDPVNKQSVSTGIFEFGGNLLSRTPTSVISILPRVRLSATSPNVNENAADGYLDVTLRHNGQKSQAALEARYSHVNLFRLYLPSSSLSFDLGAISTTADLRAIVGKNSQNLLVAQPSVNWKLTPRAWMAVGGYFTDSSYAQRTVDYIDYRNSTGSLSVGFDVTRRDTLSLTASASQFQPSGAASSNSYGVRGEWGRRISEISRYYFRIGDDQTRFGGVIAPGGTRSASSVSGGAGVSWVFQVTGLFIDATRGVYPNSTGAVARQTELRVRVQHLYTPRLTGWAGVHATQYDVLGGGTTSADGSRFALLNFGLDYRINKTMSIAPSINLVQQRLNAAASEARSNAFHLTFLYEPGRKAQEAAVRVGMY